MATGRRLTAGDALTYLLLILLVIICDFPLLYSFIQSVLTNQELYSYPPNIFTTRPTLANWSNLFTREDLLLPEWLWNSAFIASAHTLLVLLITSMAAYAFARLRFPGSNILFFLLLATLMIP